MFFRLSLPSKNLHQNLVHPLLSDLQLSTCSVSPVSPSLESVKLQSMSSKQVFLLLLQSHLSLLTSGCSLFLEEHLQMKLRFGKPFSLLFSPFFSSSSPILLIESDLQLMKPNKLKMKKPRRHKKSLDLKLRVNLESTPMNFPKTLLS